MVYKCEEFNLQSCTSSRTVKLLDVLVGAFCDPVETLYIEPIDKPQDMEVEEVSNLFYI